jgi:hypothetical protein
MNGIWMLGELATGERGKKRRDEERGKKMRRRKGGGRERERLSFCVQLTAIGISNE